MAAKKVFCMGNPLLDISSNVEQDLLDKYGLTLNNAILAEEKHFPLFDDLVKHYKVDYVAGGATQNTARVCQWLLRTPGQVTYVGAVGADENGKQLAASAQKDGLNLHYYVDAETPTGACAVLIHGKERSLVARLGAAEKYKHDHILTPEVQASLQAAEICYISSFFLTHSAATIEYVAKQYNAAGKIFAMNLSAPFLMQVPPFAAAIKGFYPYLDYVVANESEAAAFSEMQGWGSDLDLKEIAKRAAALPKEGSRPRHVIFTNGSHSTIVALSTGEVHEFPVPPVPKEEIVDTNAAGDSFVGGFLSQLAKGRDLKHAVDIGHWAAAQILRHDGCTFPDTPSHPDL